MTARRIAENDWVTRDFVTFYRQDGRPPDADNTHVVTDGHWWKVSLELRAPGYVWFMSTNGKVHFVDVDHELADRDQFFEERCNDCGATKPSGPCSVCPHIGSQAQCSAEHFARRPCLACHGYNLRSVRVRAARTFA